MSNYYSHQAARPTALTTLGRMFLRGGGVALLAAGVAFGLEWVLPEGKKPLTALMTTVAKIGTIGDAAEIQTAAINAHLDGMLQRRNDQADALKAVETNLKEGKADWDVKCGFVDVFLGGLCGGLVDMTYDPTIKEARVASAKVEEEIAIIQGTVSQIPGKTTVWDAAEKPLTFDFPSADNE